MIDDLSAPGSWVRFLAQRDGTPFTPFTEQALSQLDRGQAPDSGADELRGPGGGIINHHGSVLSDR